MSTIYWSSLFTVGGCGSEEGSLLWFALSWSAIQDLISVWLPRTMGKNMCSWMCCEPVYVNHQHAHQLTTTPCLLTAPYLRVGSNSELMFKETDLFPNTLWFFTPNYCSYLQLYEVTALDILCKNTLFGWTFSCCGACPAGVRDIKTCQLHSMQYRPSGKDSPLSVRLWTEARWPAVMYCNMGLCCCGSQWPPLGRETRATDTRISIQSPTSRFTSGCDTLWMCNAVIFRWQIPMRWKDLQFNI